MAGGRIWGSLFFLFLFFAALSTIVGVFENIVSFGMDLFHFSRKKSVAINIVLITVLSLPCILGFSVLSDFQPLGAGTNIMDLEDFLVSNNILPLGSVVYLMFCTHKKRMGMESLYQRGEFRKRFENSHRLIRGYMTYVLPWIVVIIYLKGYYDMFSKQSTTVFVTWMIIGFLFLTLVLSVTRRKKTENK